MKWIDWDYEITVIRNFGRKIIHQKNNISKIVQNTANCDKTEQLQNRNRNRIFFREAQREREVKMIRPLHRMSRLELEKVATTSLLQNKNRPLLSDPPPWEREREGVLFHLLFLFWNPDRMKDGGVYELQLLNCNKTK